MRYESLADFVPLRDAGNASRLFADRQDIRILIYTDDVRVADSDSTSFGIGLLRKFLDAHQPAFGKVTLVRVNRNSEPCPTDHALNRLTDLLKSSDSFDQIWFFGMHLADLTEAVCLNSTQDGGPESELTDAEVDYLCKVWMKTGGVLVTGDHSVPSPPKAKDPALLKRLSLGRALGRRVPRAHQLRTWDGGPTNRPPLLTYNTLQPDCDSDLNNEDGLEDDVKPQNIILLRYNLSGELDPEGKPHILFAYNRKCMIDVFPDHMHEGELVNPETLTLDGDWPARGPKPLVVAVGTDKRNGKTYNLVSTYNGLDGEAGRIVADSTWHHYFNMNLKGFSSDMSKGSVGDRIGQYYGNLAVWLSSKEKRQKMANAMFWWLYTHPRMREEASSEPLDDNEQALSVLGIGSVALQLLAQITSPCEIHELLLAHTPKKLLLESPALLYPLNSSTVNPLPSQELLLGSVVKQYFEETAGNENDISLDDEGRRAIISRIVRVGFYSAFRTHALMLDGLAVKAKFNKENFPQEDNIMADEG
jgi:hypothetical protein